MPPSPDIAPDRQACLIGLIGAHIQHSLAPILHMREGAALGLHYVYKLIDTDQLDLDEKALPDLLTSAKRLGFDGLAVTHPFKQAVVPLLDALSEDAEALGAVNTVVLRDGKSVGHNTDWYGFYEGFRRALPEAPKRRVLQLGAGGAGAAVAHAAMKLGIEELRIHDLDAARAAHEADNLNRRFGASRARAVTDLPSAIADADGLVHCTPVGMGRKSGIALAPELLRPSLWVADIVYFPLQTELLRAAQALGCRTMNGGGMLVYQAAEQIRLFSGREPDAARMLEHFHHLAAGLVLS